MTENKSRTPYGPIAIIAGAGRFPFHVAQEAKRQGYTVLALGIRGWADAALAGHVDGYEDVALGQLGRLIDRLKSLGVHHAILAGQVTKEVLLDPRAAFDAEALGLLREAGGVSVPALLSAIAKHLARAGIALLDSSAFLRANLCPRGVLTARRPSSAEEADVAVGLEAARAIAALDIGQTVVVKGRVIVAVEALEGTDAAIRRAHALVGGGLVVVKTARDNQDRRLDLPVIGTETIATLRETEAACLAVEAEMTLLLDRAALIRDADAAGLCVMGVAPPPARAA